jgi:hypothetical protein
MHQRRSESSRADIGENDSIVGCKDLQRLRLFPFPCLF